MNLNAAKAAAGRASKSFLKKQVMPCPLMNTGLLVVVYRQDDNEVIEGAHVSIAGTAREYHQEGTKGRNAEPRYIRTDVAKKQGETTDDKGIARFLPCNPGTYTATIARLPDLGARVLDLKPVEARVPAQDCPIYMIPVPVLTLRLVAVDDHFAPNHEALDIRYQVIGYSDAEVKLTIESERYGSDPLFEHVLSQDEKLDGTHTFSGWSGKIAGGALKEKFVHPLLSPFTVTLQSGLARSSLRFRVLYHSVKLRRGPWTPEETPPEKSDKNAWLQYHLDELGYVGGPVGKDTDSYLKKAIVRYKANHPKFVKFSYSDYNDTIDQLLEEAIEAKEARRDYLGDEAFGDANAESKVRIEALPYYGDEFSKAQKWEKDAERLNRPLVPIEVDIFIKAKNDAPADRDRAAVAVGPARVTFRFIDPDEDLSTQYAPTEESPSRIGDYLEVALALEQGRKDKNGDNCPKPLGGLRTATDDYAYEPFLLGDAYVPWVAAKDTTQHAVYVTASVDGDKYPKRLGRAGVLLRPSIIAGDAYKVRAELDFTGATNQQELERLHGIAEASERPSAETGTFRVWRTNRVTMLVNWPARRTPLANHADHAWDAVKEEFAKAYIDIDTGGIVEKSITDVLSSDEYKDIVAAHTKFTERSAITLNADAMVGVALPVQTQPMDDHKTLLKQLVAGDYCDKIKKPLQAKLSETIRKTHANGFIVVPFLTHKPIDLKEDPGTGKNDTKATELILATSSISQDDSLVFVDQKDRDVVYCVTAHEMGHNFFLKHWENAPGKTPIDHDIADHNCMMSYTGESAAGRFSHQAPGQYRPHFCGKCNLKLRGWNVTHHDMPGRAPLDPELALTVSVDKPNPRIGDEVTYTVTVTNAGDKDPGTVEVYGPKPNGIAYASHTISSGFFGPVAETWTIYGLDPAATAMLTLKVTVLDAAKDTEQVEHEFSVIKPMGSAGVMAYAKLAVTTVALGPFIFVNGEPSEGDDVELHLSVDNTAPAKATGVKGKVALPGGLTFKSSKDASQGSYDPSTHTWDVGELVKDAKATIKVICSVDPGNSGKSLDVKLTATAAEPDRKASSGGATRAVKVTDVPTVALDPSVYAGGDPSVDEDVELHVSVQNTAAAKATGVTAVVTLPLGLTFKAFNDPSQGTYDPPSATWTIGDLEKDKKASAKIVAHVEAGNDGKSLEVKLTATAAQPDRKASSGGATRAVKVTDVPMVTLDPSVYASGGDPCVGEDVELHVSVQNTAAAKATGVKAVVTLPQGLTFKAFNDPSQGTYDPPSATWTIGDLEKDKKASAKIVAHVEAGSDGKILEVKLTATAAQPDRKASSGGATRAVKVTDVPMVTLDPWVYVYDADPGVGDDVSMSLSVTNKAAAKATGVKGKVTLPPGLTFKSFDGKGHGTYDAPSSTWTIGDLIKDGKAEARLVCTVDSGGAGKTFTIKLEASADQPDRNAKGGGSSRDVVVSQQTKVNLSLLFFPMPGDPAAGGAVRLCAYVTNKSNNPATNVKAVLTLPPGLTYQGFTGQTHGSYDTGSSTWTVGNLDPAAEAKGVIECVTEKGTEGKTLAFSLRVTVDQVNSATDHADKTVTVKS